MNDFFQVALLSLFKRKGNTILLALISAPIFWVFFNTPQTAHSYQAGAPVGKTGSPGDNGVTCSGCHSGNNSPSFLDAFMITDVDAPDVYQAGEVYSFEVVIESLTSSVFGFELIAEDSNGNAIGEIIITDPANTQLKGSGEYITHTTAGSSGVGGKIWSFNWQAPVDFDGAVTFYAAGNIANGNGGGSGDIILTDNYPILISTEVAIEGCTESEAANYNTAATIEDGTCMYGQEYVNTLLAQIGVGSNCQSIDVPLNLPVGWSMFGYTCAESLDVLDAFTEIVDQVVIVKDYQGNAYLPEWGFNGIGDMNYAVGYQIKLTEQVNDFQFCPMLIDGN